jgi:transglutaminase-like putative cysteine protease
MQHTDKVHTRHIRHIALVLLTALLVEAGLVGWFTRIPNARAYIPLRVAGSPQAYDWSPSNAPRWFHHDDPTLPQAAYFRAALPPDVGGNAPVFEQELTIMDWVRQQAVVEDAWEAIPGDPIGVHQAMQAGTPAQCGNFATLLAACSASVGLLDVRTWFLLSYDGLGGQGHVANEVWDPVLGKWVFLDPMNNAYVLLDGRPASLLEVREMVLTGQRERLEPVIGENAHTPREELLDLYELVMAVPSLDAAHTPLSSYYGQTWPDRFATRLPDVGGLRYQAKRTAALLSGAKCQVILLDDLARAHSQPMPIRQVKALLAATGIVGLLIGALAVWLAMRGLRLARTRLAHRT